MKTRLKTAPRGWAVLLMAGLLAAGSVTSSQAQDARRGWLGFAWTGGTQGADAAVVVETVYPDSPADRAGLREQDVIVRVNRLRATGDIMRSLDVQRGDEVELRVRRGSRDRTLTLTATQRPSVTVLSGRAAPSAPRGIARGTGRILSRGDNVIIINGDTLRIDTDSLMMQVDSLQNRLRLFYVDSLGPRLRSLERELQGWNMKVWRDSAFAGDSARWPGAREPLIVRSSPGSFFFNVGERAVAGAEVTTLNPGLAEYFGTRNGVLVLRVASRTPAARAGLEEGDVITAVNGSTVRSIDQLRERIARSERARLSVIRKRERLELRLP